MSNQFNEHELITDLPSGFGLLGAIQSAFIPTEFKVGLVDVVSRLETNSRIAFERAFLETPTIMTSALREALNVINDLRTHDTDALWEEYLVTVARDKGVSGIRGSQMFETSSEYRRHKDEQKARMLQVSMREGYQMHRGVWSVLKQTADQGFTYIMSDSDRANDSLEEHSDILLNVYRYLLHDQSELIHDIIHAAELDVEDASYDPVHNADNAEPLELLKSFEDEVGSNGLSSQDVLKIRHAQYLLLERSGIGEASHARAAHLMRAFAESLRILHDVLAEFVLVSRKIRSSESERQFSLAVQAIQKLPVGLDVRHPHIHGLRDVLINADYLRMRVNEAGQHKYPFKFFSLEERVNKLQEVIEMLEMTLSLVSVKPLQFSSQEMEEQDVEYVLQAYSGLQALQYSVVPNFVDTLDRVSSFGRFIQDKSGISLQDMSKEELGAIEIVRNTRGKELHLKHAKRSKDRLVRDVLVAEEAGLRREEQQAFGATFVNALEPFAYSY